MKIKQLAEDFRVTELLTPTLGDGPYIVFTLTKKGMGTLDAVQKLADIWKVPSRFIGFAGLKDKHAVTTQYCSVKNVSKDGIANTQTNNLTLKVLGTAPDPIRLGVHTANQFSIVVREIDALPEKKTVFLNTFGDQRFSTHNAAIGKALILADYLTAVKHILETHPPAQDLIVQHLEEHPADGLGALKHVNLKLLQLYIHAYQSLLWNNLVTSLPTPPEIIPIVGFGSSPGDPYVKEQLKNENLTPRNFVLKSFPELSEEGTERNTTLTLSDLDIGGLEADELHAGKHKTTITFSLPPGSYATEIIKQLFNANPQEPS